MSNEITNACRPAQIPSTKKNVLLALADRADHAGTSWPSIPTICTSTCYARRSVINALQWLEKAGYVVIARMTGNHNTYRINLGRLVEELQRIVDRDGGSARREVKDALVWARHALGDAGLTSAPNAPVQQAHQCTSRTPTSAADAPPPCTTSTPPVQQMHPNHQEPSGNHQTTTKRARDVATESIKFQTFWAAYPRKVDKTKALKAFERLNVDDKLLAAMLAAISLQSKSREWHKEEGRFVPYPAKWLKDRRWEDGSEPEGIDERRPAWALNAGFANRYDAENAGCFQRNAAAFSGGRRVTQPAPARECEESA